MRASHLGFAVCFCVAALQPAFAELRFERPLVEVGSPDPTAETIEASFPFVNDGDGPVRIASASSSCGCTKATFDPRDFAPGERGEVKAVFTVGSRVGRQVKRVTVRTSDGRSATLTLAVDLPSAVQLRPRSVLWVPGEERKAKTVEVRVIRERPLSLALRGEAAERAGFDAELVEVEAGRRYNLAITPRPGASGRVRFVLVEKPEDAGEPRAVTAAFAQVVADAEPDAEHK